MKQQFLLILVLLTVSPLVFGTEHQWHWVKAGNNAITGWDVATGNADVVINGGVVTATLFWSDSGKDVQIALKGSIASNKLTIKETVRNSDYSGSTYIGTRTVKKWPEFSGQPAWRQ